MVTPEQRRKLLSESSPKLGEVGKAFMQAGRWGEALECLTAAGETRDLEYLLQKALDTGDLFYARAAAKALGRKLDIEELKTISDAADRAEKFVFKSQADAGIQDQS